MLILETDEDAVRSEVCTISIYPVLEGLGFRVQGIGSGLKRSRVSPASKPTGHKQYKHNALNAELLTQEAECLSNFVGFSTHNPLR